MKSIVERGVKQTETGARTMNLTDKDKELQSVLGSHRTNIKIVGAGGAGNNTLSRMHEIGIQGVEIIAVNTDAQDLLFTTADNKILIGRHITNGLGAGSNPQIGEESAKENEEEIREALKDADMVFVTCGLGGGTGTGSAPVVAEIAKSLGALTISVVTLPFTEEGVMRWENAQSGLQKLQKNSDTVIIIQNDKLLEIAPELPLGAAFKVADEVLVNAVKGITELVTEKGLVNLDFADVRAIMKDGGTAMVGIGESDSDNRAMDAIVGAINNPLLEVDITGARSALINITGGASMSLKDAKIAMRELSQKLDPTARVIWGARYDDSLKDTLRVLLIVTGLQNTTDRVKPINSSGEKPKTQKAPDENYTLEPALWNPGTPPEKKTVIATPRGPHVTRETIPPTESKAPAPTTGMTQEPVEDELTRDFSQPVTIAKAPEQPPVVIAPNPENQKTKSEPEKPSFDIRESDRVKQSQTPAAPVRNKRVFTEIFEEEAQGDLAILVECILQLQQGNADQKVLKDIRSACNSLKNTAQLFTFEKIEQLTESVASFMDFVLKQKSFAVELVHYVIEETPDIINELMFEDNEAVPRVAEVQQKIASAQANINGRVPDDTSEDGESKKKVKNAFFSPKIDDTHLASSKMNETVQHVKKLFG